MLYSDVAQLRQMGGSVPRRYVSGAVACSLSVVGAVGCSLHSHLGAFQQGDFGCGQLISASVLRMGTMLCAVMYSAASSALAAEAMTNLMICAMERIGPLARAMGSSSERKT